MINVRVWKLWIHSSMLIHPSRWLWNGTIIGKYREMLIIQWIFNYSVLSDLGLIWRNFEIEEAYRSWGITKICFETLSQDEIDPFSRVPWLFPSIFCVGLEDIMGNLSWNMGCPVNFPFQWHLIICWHASFPKKGTLEIKPIHPSSLLFGIRDSAAPCTVQHIGCRCTGDVMQALFPREAGTENCGWRVFSGAKPLLEFDALFYHILLNMCGWVFCFNFLWFCFFFFDEFE